MLRIICGRWLPGAAFGLLLATTGFAQPPATLPSAPVPVLPPSPPPPDPPPPVSLPPPPISGPSISPVTGVPSFGDEHLPPPGWFFNIDLAVVAPNFKNQLSGTVVFPGGTRDVVVVPGADLDWTFSPKIELGYRMPLDFGSVVLGYRSLVSEGKDSASDSFGSLGQIQSRLNLNQVDLDYRSMEFDVGGKWNLFWKAGVRFASIYYDSQLNMDVAPSVFVANTMNARVTNSFIGAGPHAVLQMDRPITPNLAFYTNLEGAVVIGRVHQSFEEVFAFDGLTSKLGAASEQSTTQAVPTLALQLGLRWTPMGPDSVRFSLGYQYEYWWMLGRLNNSRGELESQGVFFNGEFRF